MEQWGKLKDSEHRTQESEDDCLHANHENPVIACQDHRVSQIHTDLIRWHSEELYPMHPIRASMIGAKHVGGTILDTGPGSQNPHAYIPLESSWPALVLPDNRASRYQGG